MDYIVTMADLPEQHTAVVRGTVDLAGISDFLGGAFGEAMGVLLAQGMEPSGPPFGRYHPTTNGGLEVEAGFPVATPIAPFGRVEASTLPGGHAARVVHAGAYGDVPRAYEAAQRWVDANHLKTYGDPWECYLDAPEVAEPRTEVFLPCTEAHR